MLCCLYTDAANYCNQCICWKADKASGLLLMQALNFSVSLEEQQNSISLGRSLF